MLGFQQYLELDFINFRLFYSVATDFGKHLLILIQDHLVWLSQGASRVVFLLSLSAIHNCSMSHYCVLFYTLILWYNRCRFSSHYDISLRKVRVSFTTQGHCELSEISPALSGSKLSKINPWCLTATCLFTCIPTWLRVKIKCESTLLLNH